MSTLAGAVIVLALAGATAGGGDGEAGSTLFLAQAPTPGPVPMLELPKPDADADCPPDGIAELCRLEAELEAARQAERQAGDDPPSRMAARRRTAHAEYALALAHCDAEESAGATDDGRVTARAADCRARAEAARERAVSEAVRLPPTDDPDASAGNGPGYGRPGDPLQESRQEPPSRGESPEEKP